MQQALRMRSLGGDPFRTRRTCCVTRSRVTNVSPCDEAATVATHPRDSKSRLEQADAVYNHISLWESCIQDYSCRTVPKHTIYTRTVELLPLGSPCSLVVIVVEIVKSVRLFFIGLFIGLFIFLFLRLL